MFWSYKIIFIQLWNSCKSSFGNNEQASVVSYVLVSRWQLATAFDLEQKLDKVQIDNDE